MLAHLAFHAYGLSFAALAVWRLSKRPSLPRALVWGALLGGLALPIAVLLTAGVPGGQRMFAIMSHGAETVFVHLPLLCAGCALAWWGRARARAWVAVALGASLLGVGGFAFYIEPYDLQLSRYELALPEVEAPLRIAIVADLQTDDFGDYERGALELALAQEPDLILLPGDYIQQHDPELRAESEQRMRAALLELGFGAPRGAVAVGGNVDPPGWERIFEGSEVLAYGRTTRVELDGLVVTALSMPDSFHTGLQRPPVEGLHIVLGHAPDAVLSTELGGDLYVAGHCHGGQVRVPFLGPPVTLSAVPRAWTEGVHEVRPGEWLCMSRGIGVERGWAPPLRFLCKPEVVVLDLVPEREEHALNAWADKLGVHPPILAAGSDCAPLGQLAAGDLVLMAGEHVGSVLEVSAEGELRVRSEFTNLSLQSEGDLNLGPFDPGYDEAWRRLRERLGLGERDWGRVLLAVDARASALVLRQLAFAGDARRDGARSELLVLVGAGRPAWGTLELESWSTLHAEPWVGNRVGLAYPLRHEALGSSGVGSAPQRRYGVGVARLDSREEALQRIASAFTQHAAEFGEEFRPYFEVEREIQTRELLDYWQVVRAEVGTLALDFGF